MAQTNFAPFILGGPKKTITLIATADLGAGIAVKLDASNSGQVVVCESGIPLGFTTGPVQAGLPANIAIMGSDGFAQAGTAITVTDSPVACKVTTGGQIIAVASNKDAIAFWAFQSVADASSAGSYVPGIVGAGYLSA